MKENLLHFIWKYKLFSTNKLVSTAGETIEIKATGSQNLNAGPDFLHAKISIGDQLWAGNIEIHIQSSDWYAHGHERDDSYQSVILHVVWEHDVDIFYSSNQVLATLELKNLISPKTLRNYKKLFDQNKKWINCEKEIATTGVFVLNNWLERLYFERLEKKAEQIQQVLEKNHNNWEATLFVSLAKNFGLKVNGEAFLSFANSFDFSIVRKVSSNRYQLEALFFGQAGLLTDPIESMYYRELKEAYRYLKRKYQLQEISKNQVQFFRLRPNNFPTIRLSQLADLYYNYQSLFSKLIEIEDINDFYKLLGVSTAPFWQSHYTFETESKKRIKKLTNPFIDLLLINTIIPLKFMFLKSMGKSDFGSLLKIIEQIEPEKNTIISKFNDLKVESTNAFKTQALLQLKNEYCNKQLCLQCGIGREVLKP
jgi:hypothetical protein